MIYLLDTNAFSDLMNSHLKLSARIAALSQVDRVVICPIVWGEICFGIERLPQGQRRQNLASAAAMLKASVACESLPESAGEHYAMLKMIRLQHSIGAEENDLWIAAAALAIGATLISRDKAIHQLEIHEPNLKVEDWTI